MTIESSAAAERLTGMETVGAAVAAPGARELGFFATLGAAMGAVTVGVLWRLYPPPPGPWWMILPAIGVVSGLLLLSAARVTYRRRGELAVQWLLFGFAIVMALWGTVAVSEEVIAFVKWRISNTIGVAGV